MLLRALARRDARSRRSPQTSRPFERTRWRRAAYAAPTRGVEQAARCGTVGEDEAAPAVVKSVTATPMKNARLMACDGRKCRYRVAIDPLPVSVRSGARVPDPGTARGRRRGGPIRLGGPRQRATLAILLLRREPRRAGRAARRRSLRRRAAGHRRHTGAAAGLGAAQARSVRTRSRRAPPGYVLHVDADGLDLDRFER